MPLLLNEVAPETPIALAPPAGASLLISMSPALLKGPPAPANATPVAPVAPQTTRWPVDSLVNASPGPAAVKPVAADLRETTWIRPALSTLDANDVEEKPVAPARFPAAVT